MTPDEFVMRAMAAPGIPWQRWRSDWRAADCFGLLVLWHRHVLGFEIERPEANNLADGYPLARGWQELPGPEDGATCFMSWRGGAPTHCGVLLDARRVLHSEGGEEIPGGVRVSRLEAVRRLHGLIRFYRYIR